MQSPAATQQSQFGGMDDAFAGLSLGTPAAQTASAPAPAQKPSPFAALGQVSTTKVTPLPAQPNYSGGNFFDTKPTQKAAPAPPQASRTFSSSSGFGDFDSAPGVSPAAAQNSSSSAMGDLFDFSTPATAPAPPPIKTISSPPPQSSVFNLSQPQQQPLPKQPAPQTMSGWGNADAWGTNDAWKTPDVSVKSPMAATPKQASSSDFGWGSGSLANQSIVPGGSGGFSPASTTQAKPTVAADDDFGGWSSAAPVTPGVTTSSGKPATAFGGASEDLFSNVWE